MSETPKNKGGRPRKEIDEKLLYDLAKIQCTYSEMSAILGVSDDTLKNRYSDIIEKGKEEGKASLRRMQYLAAQKGNVAMLIWLGKQLLGQREPERNIDPDGTGDKRVMLANIIAGMMEKA